MSLHYASERVCGSKSRSRSRAAECPASARLSGDLDKHCRKSVPSVYRNLAEADQKEIPHQLHSMGMNQKR